MSQEQFRAALAREWGYVGVCQVRDDLIVALARALKARDVGAAWRA